MHADVADALAATTLTAERQQRIRVQFADRAHVTSAAVATAVAAAVAEQAAEAADPTVILRTQLDACFYGTLTPRDKASGLTGMGRAKDGWRDGQSHPFKGTYGGKATSWDVESTPDISRAQYEGLRTAIGAGEVTPAK